MDTLLRFRTATVADIRRRADSLESLADGLRCSIGFNRHSLESAAECSRRAYDAISRANNLRALAANYADTGVPARFPNEIAQVEAGAALA